MVYNGIDRFIIWTLIFCSLSVTQLQVKSCLGLLQIHSNKKALSVLPLRLQYHFDCYLILASALKNYISPLCQSPYSLLFNAR